jgi:multiple sugar transport system substrate-binding protein
MNVLTRYYKLFLLPMATGLILLASCSREKQSSEKTATEQAAVQPTTMTISTNNGAMEDDLKRLEEQRQIKALFQKKHPNVDIVFSSWQFSPETFMAKMAAGTCTDIIGLFATEGTTVIDKGLALDLTDLAKSWDKYEYLKPELLQPFSRNGRIYGIPGGGIGGGYVIMLFYNTKLFKQAGIVDSAGKPKPPDTWEEFVNVAQKLTDRKIGRAGFGILAERGGGGWHFLNWVWQAGGDFEKKIDGKWKAVFDSPEAATALQFIKDLRWKYDVLQKDLFCSNDDLFQQFVSERIAMALFTPEYLVYLVEKLKMPLEDIGMALLPAGPAGRANQMGGAYSIINPTIPKDRQQMAFNFIVSDFELETIEMRCKLMKEQGRLFGYPTLPIFKTEYQSHVDQIVNKYKTLPSYPGLMDEAAKYIHIEPPLYSQQLYSEFLSPAIQTVLTDKDADPAKLLKESAEKFQQRFLDKVP